MKCEICNKPIKENTDGNKRYCQGHSFFEVEKFIEKNPRSKLARMRRLYA